MVLFWISVWVSFGFWLNRFDFLGYWCIIVLIMLMFGIGCLMFDVILIGCKVKSMIVLSYFSVI